MRHLQVTGKKKQSLWEVNFNTKFQCLLFLLISFWQRYLNSSCHCIFWIQFNGRGDFILIYNSPDEWLLLWAGTQALWSQTWNLSFWDVAVPRLPWPSLHQDHCLYRCFPQQQDYHQTSLEDSVFNFSSNFCLPSMILLREIRYYWLISTLPNQIYIKYQKGRRKKWPPPKRKLEY